MEKLVKIILASLFFLCLLHMPYGYYELVRMIALIGFTILAYLAYKGDNKVEMIIFIGLAILFQPFKKLALGREIWNMVDVIVGIGLLLSLFIKQKDKKSEHV
jgi:hypothetical protein